MEWGQQREFFEGLVEDDSTLATPLDSEPDLPEELEEFGSSFYILNQSRDYNDGVANYLKLTELESYCKLYDIDDIDIFLRLMQAMDEAYVTYMHKRRGKK